jgi:UDP:flavonoid glycosyltransferase YjiC (YdhE family)
MKILFATMPFDGHFNPLTGVAVHLRKAGHDVRWYAGPSYAARLQRLDIPHFPFRRATEINQQNIGELFPERETLRGPALIRFELKKVFLSNVESFFLDIQEIDATFPFDMVFCDGAFYAMKLIKEKLGKRVVSFGVAPSMETSKDVPPNFMGWQPAKNAIGRLVHQGMRTMMERMVLSEGTTFFNQMLATYGLEPISGSVFDVSYRSPDVVFQSGVPGFAYPRRDPNPRVRYVGALLPHRSTTASEFPHMELLDKIKPVILVSQGTVDNKDPGKLMVPALEALADSGALLIVTTGYGQTEELRKAFPQENVIVEDYVDFGLVLDHTDLFICNGGYGSILFSLSKGVPVVTAGVLEGKNDINAHVEYFGVGINLHTENPKPEDIRRAVERVLTEPRWRQNVARLQKEFSEYHPYELIDAYLSNGTGSG